MVLCTLVFEGSKEQTDKEQKITFEIANRHQGVIAGAENGKNGFKLTFVIAYIRDFCMKYNILGESFESAVLWDKIKDLVVNVKKRIRDEVAKAGCVHPPFTSFRIT